MKRNEAKLVLEYHKSIFPEWGEWFTRQHQAARNLIFDAWVKAFRTIDLEDAKEATDRMLAGDCKKPFRDEDHLAALVADATKCRSRRYALEHHTVDGQPTVSCPYCLDTGFVECWRVDLIHKMAVSCSCPRGNGNSGAWDGARGRGGNVQRYDPEKCYRVGDDSPRWLRVREQVEADIAAGVSRQLAGVEEF